MFKISFPFLACFLLTFSVQAQIKLIAPHSDDAAETESALRWNVSTGAVLDPATGLYDFRPDDGLNLLGFAPDSFANMRAVPLANSSELDMYDGSFLTLDAHPVLDTMGKSSGSNLQITQHSLATGQTSVLNIQVYPNPTRDVLRIDATDLAGLRVYDTRGRLIVAHSGSGLDQIDVATWAPGVYFLRGSGSDGSLRSAKFIKE